MTADRKPNLLYAVAWVLLLLGLLGWLWSGEWRWAASGVLAMLCCGVIGSAVSRKGAR